AVPWKHATLSSGQTRIAADLRRALHAAADADLLVAAGTSLVVGPINEMLPLAAHAGARTAILTASETPFDDIADWKITAPLESVLPEVALRVREEQLA